MVYQVTYIPRGLGSGTKTKVIEADTIKEQGSYTDLYRDGGIVFSIKTELVDFLEKASNVSTLQPVRMMVEGVPASGAGSDNRG